MRTFLLFLLYSSAFGVDDLWRLMAVWSTFFIVASILKLTHASGSTLCARMKSNKVENSNVESLLDASASADLVGHSGEVLGQQRLFKASGDWKRTLEDTHPALHWMRHKSDQRRETIRTAKVFWRSQIFICGIATHKSDHVDGNYIGILEGYILPRVVSAQIY